MHTEFSTGESSVVIPATVKLAIIKITFYYNTIRQLPLGADANPQTTCVVFFCHSCTLNEGFQVLPRNVFSPRDGNSEAAENMWFGQHLI